MFSRRHFQLILPCLWLAASWAAAGQTPSQVTWIPGHSVKAQQLLGELGSTNGADTYATDTDRQTGAPLLNQTYTRYQVGGTDLGYNFEDGNNQLVFLFGDTLYFGGGDTMSWSSTTTPVSGTATRFFRLITTP